jgi:hypothetical protein
MKSDQKHLVAPIHQFLLPRQVFLITFQNGVGETGSLVVPTARSRERLRIFAHCKYIIDKTFRTGNGKAFHAL